MKRKYLAGAISFAVVLVAGLGFYLTNNKVTLSADTTSSSFTCGTGTINGCSSNSAIKLYSSKEEYNPGEKVDLTLEFAFNASDFDKSKYSLLTWVVEDPAGNIIYLPNNYIRYVQATDKMQWSWDLKANANYAQNGNIKSVNGNTYIMNRNSYATQSAPAGEYKIKVYASYNRWFNQNRTEIAYVPIIVTGQVQTNSFVAVKLGTAISFGVENTSTKSIGFNINTPARWSVKDSTGKTIYTSPSSPVISGVKPGESMKLSWDQKDSAGVQVPVGNYTININSRNEFYTALAVHIEQ